ncbi:putative transcriptional regulator with HTH domain [Mucilaginibacter sp. UYCu711]
MKKKKLFISAFAIVLTFTMVLSVYTRVKADPDPVQGCVETGAAGGYTGSTTYADCVTCNDIGYPEYYTVDDVTYFKQARGYVHNQVTLTNCYGGGVGCYKTTYNQSWDPGPCEDYIYVVSTGTGN